MAVRRKGGVSIALGNVKMMVGSDSRHCCKSESEPDSSEIHVD